MNPLLANCHDCNLIIFSYSALKAKHSTFYGYHRETDKEAKKYITDGLVFDQNYAASNWPFQAQVSLLTGQLPRTHQVYNNDFHNKLHYKKYGVEEDVIAPDEMTLNELAKKNGYETFLIGGEPHKSFFSPKVGFTRGVDQYHDHCLHLHEDKKYIHKFIEKMKDKKFMGIFHSVRTHFPHFLLPKEAQTEFVNYVYKGYFPTTDADYLKEIRSSWGDLNSFLKTNPKMAEASENAQRSFTRDAYWYLHQSRTVDGKKGIEHFINIYDQAIGYTDFFIGEIFRSLEQNNLLDKTIVIITSDVGDNVFEVYKFPDGKIYEPTFSYAMITPVSARTPMIIYHPELKKKKTGLLRYSGISNTTDILPTISSLLGWKERKSNIDGIDLITETNTRKYSESYTFRPHRGMELALHNESGSYLINLRRKFYFDDVKKRLYIDRDLKKLKIANFKMLSHASKSKEDIVTKNERNEVTKQIRWPEKNQSNEIKEEKK